MIPSTIHIGDDYTADIDRQLKWTEPSANAWADIDSADWSVQMIVKDRSGNVVSTIDGEVEFTDNADPTPDVYPATTVVKFDYESADTALLSEGLHHVSVKATLDDATDRVVTLVSDSFVAVN